MILFVPAWKYMKISSISLCALYIRQQKSWYTFKDEGKPTWMIGMVFLFLHFWTVIHRTLLQKHKIRSFGHTTQKDYFNVVLHVKEEMTNTMVPLNRWSYHVCTWDIGCMMSLGNKAIKFAIKAGSSSTTIMLEPSLSLQKENSFAFFFPTLEFNCWIF